MTRSRARFCVYVTAFCAAAVLPVLAAIAPPVIVVNPTPSDCYSGAGCLDPAFGTLGKVVQNVGGSPQYAWDVAGQPDGKSVVVGATRFIATPNDFSWRIARFNDDGTMDTGFATNGFATIDLISGANNLEQARAVAIQPDGKILVAGWGQGNNSDYVAVVRFTTAGALDTSFGTGGKVVITSLGQAYILTSLAIQPDGKIVGLASQNATYSSEFLFASVFRLQPNGSFDTKFGSKGFRSLANGFMDAMALQSNGGLILAGGKAVGDARDLVVTRVNPNGTWDNRFGSRGIASVDFFGFEDGISTIAVTADNSIILGGRTNTATYSTSGSNPYPDTFNFAFAKLTATGSLVTSFGSAGKVVLDMHGGYDVISDVFVQADGKLVFGGSARLPGGANRYLIAGRLTAAGSLDSTFGTGGITETGMVQDDGSGGAAIDSIGRLYVIGYSYVTDPTNNPNTWIVARYFR